MVIYSLRELVKKTEEHKFYEKLEKNVTVACKKNIYKCHFRGKSPREKRLPTHMKGEHTAPFN